jgi:hypothetical protein
MLLASLIAALQGGIWAAFSPIAPALEGIWGWTGDSAKLDFTIALLAGWGPVAYLVTCWPFMYGMERCGLRVPTIIAAALVFAGSMLKVWTASNTTGVYLSHAAQILNAAAGPVAMGIGPVVSAAWFAPGERTFSTSVIAMSNTLGVAAMFLIGPWMVPSDATATDLLHFWYVWAVATGLVLVACVVYLPSRPPTPPSRSASTQRTDFFGGMRSILGCFRCGSGSGGDTATGAADGGVPKRATPAAARAFWLVTAAYGIVTGVYGGWGSILANNCMTFLTKDDAESTAGWLGFWSTLAGCVGGVAFSLYIDRGSVAAPKKLLLIILSLGSAACFLIFTLMVSTDVIEYRPWILYVTSIAGGLLVNGQIPLFYEAGVEAMYPVEEGTSTVVLTIVNNLGAGVFLIVPMVTPIGAWVNWAMVGSCAAAFVCLLPFDERQARSALDAAAAVLPTESSEGGGGASAMEQPLLNAVA